MRIGRGEGVCARSERSASVERRNTQIVELADRVGFRPDAEASCVRKRRIAMIDPDSAVPRYDNVVAEDLDVEAVPLIGGDGSVPARDPARFAVLHDNRRRTDVSWRSIRRCDAVLGAINRDQ